MVFDLITYYHFIIGRPLLAELRSPPSSSGRLLWRKQTLKLDISEALSDPTRTLRSLNNSVISAKAGILQCGSRNYCVVTVARVNNRIESAALMRIFACSRLSRAKKLSTTALSWQLSRSLTLRVMLYGCSYEHQTFTFV